MPAVAAVILFIQQFLPVAISLGADIATLLPSLKATFNEFATAQGATQADFDAFHQLIAPYEADLAAKAAQAESEIASGTTTS